VVRISRVGAGVPPGMATLPMTATSGPMRGTTLAMTVVLNQPMKLGPPQPACRGRRTTLLGGVADHTPAVRPGLVKEIWGGSTGSLFLGGRNQTLESNVRPRPTAPRTANRGWTAFRKPLSTLCRATSTATFGLAAGRAVKRRLQMVRFSEPAPSGRGSVTDSARVTEPRPEGAGSFDSETPCQRGLLRLSGWLHYGDIAQVPVELLVVEAEADDEAVRDLEATEFHRHLDDAARRAVQQRADGERIGPTPGQRLQQVARSESRWSTMSSTSSTSSPSMPSSRSLAMRTQARRARVVGEARNGQEVDFHRNRDLRAPTRSERKHEPFSTLISFRFAVAVLLRDLGRPLPGSVAGSVLR